MIADFPDLCSLSAGDKLLLAAELLNEATTETDGVEIDPELLATIEERIDDLEKNPDSGLSWEEVKKAVRAK